MGKLKLSDWASIAEIVGGVVVVMSLVYVGIQIKQTTIEVREGNRQELISRAFNATGRVAASPELAAIFSKVAEGQPLSAPEATQYAYFVRGLLYDIQEAFLLHLEDRLSDEYWDTREATFLVYMTNPSAREVYERDKAIGVLHDRFVHWADQRLANQ